MASKRIFKFVLRIVVVLAIVAGIYFGIRALTNKNNGNVLIIEASQNQKISTKIFEIDYDNMQNIAESNSPQYFMVLRCKEMTNALVKYYNYYVNLTCFENTSKAGDRNAIIAKINELSKCIDETKQRLAVTSAITGNQTETQKRFVKTIESFFEQTKVLIEVDELLKDYVYKVNYGVVSTGIVYEAQLEMIKDYSKAVFNEAIYGKQQASVTSSLLTNSSDETGFVRNIQKFLQCDGIATNSDREVYFAQDYMKIDKQTLLDFYKQNSQSNKQQFVTSKSSDEALYTNLTKLLNYIKQSTFVD